MTKASQNLIINGSGISSGGTFNNVKINGEGTVSGDLHCNLIKIHGSADFTGNITTQSTAIFGQTNMTGKINSDSIKIFGQTEIRGDLTTKLLKLRGTAEIHGKLIGGEIHSFGEFTAKNGCDADDFQANGTLNINGTLNAEKVKIQLYYSDSQIQEIGGENIRISKGSLFNVFNWFKPNTAELIAEVIEGDVIYLENTKAKVVRGNNVVIGPGCEIDLIEYKNRYQKSEKSTVTENKRI